MSQLFRKHHVELFSFFLFFAAAGLSAQSLVGTWVPTEPILVNIKLSLTFTDSGYQVDCSLGETVGVYSVTNEKIYFKPTHIGISSGEAGKNEIWDYNFVDDQSFYLRSGPIKVRFLRQPG